MPACAFRLTLLLLLTAGAAKPARAHEPGPVTTSWYGAESLLGDLFAVAAMSGCAQKLDNGTLCLGLFVLPGPVVHASHGYLDRALLSAAYRVALPLAGAGIGHLYERGCDPDRFLCITDTQLGLVLGMAAAVTIDAVVAFEPVGPARVPAMMPTVALAPGTLAVGVTGRF
jgi:hypothetical protein